MGDEFSAVKSLEKKGRVLILIPPGQLLPELGVCSCTNWVYAYGIIFVFSSPFDLLIEWQGIGKKLPEVVVQEGDPERRLLQAVSLRP